MGVNNTTEAKEYWYQLMNKCELMCDHKLLFYRNNILEYIINNGNTDRLRNLPVNFNESQLRSIFID